MNDTLNEHNQIKETKKAGGKGIFNLKGIESGFAVASGFFLFSMMILITVDILCRLIFNAPIQVVFELVEMLMVFVIFLGFAHAQRKGGFIRIELFIHRFAEQKRRPFEYINYIASIIFFVVFCWRSLIIAWDSFVKNETTRGLVPLLIYPARAAIFLGGVLMLIELIVETVRHRREKTCHRN